jgi:two-component system sensor histidine kinase ArlS
MNIKKSLTIKFTAIVAGILIAFSIFIFQFSEIFRKNEFTDRLRNVSRNVVVNYLDKEELTPVILKLMFEKHLNRFPEERLIIADEHYEVIFASEKTQDIEIDLLKRLYKSNTEFIVNNSDTEYIAYIVPHYGANYFVVSSAIDITGQSKLKFLKSLLIILNIACIVLAAVSGWYFSRQALQPIKLMIAKVEAISESSLFLRVITGNGQDEIAQLAIVFNTMLERIEKSFTLQKMFVSNASHEFRTPLTVMKGQIEVLLLQNRNEEEYLKTFNSLQEDIQNLISLINGLTDLANANADFPKISFKEVSIVEVIMDAKEELSKQKSKYKITLDWDEFPADEESMQTKGDYALLKSAFVNLMDNACKFSSDLQCEVKVKFDKLSIKVSFIDKGPGIAKSDLSNIFQPFFRANDTRQVAGYGIGLSLVKKTIEIHKGKISLQSQIGVGSNFEIILPNNYIG